MTFEGFRVAPQQPRVLIRSVFFWSVRCHTLVQETHRARSVALCSAVSARCVEVMTAGVCGNHLLAREDPCSRQTNIRILLVSIRNDGGVTPPGIPEIPPALFPPPHSFLFLKLMVLSPVRRCAEQTIRTVKASSCSAMMLLLHQVSVCSQGQKQYAVNCTMASSG